MDGKIVIGNVPSSPKSASGAGNDKCEESTGNVLIKLRLVLWGQHQALIAGVLFASLVAMTAYFSYLWSTRNGLIDIDRAETAVAEFKVDINSAELGEIIVLPGVGQKLAQAIIDHRQQSGGFSSIDELCEVPGIGKSKLASLQPYLLPISPLAENH